MAACAAINTILDRVDKDVRDIIFAGAPPDPSLPS